MIQVDSISVCFKGQRVLHDFSVSAAQGEKVAIVGPSGCGKSTLLRSLLGFVVPDRGRVCINGVEMDGGSVWRLRRLMGYAAQEPDLGEGTVGEVIDRPFAYKSNEPIKNDRDKVDELLCRFGLDGDILTKEIDSLSGGEKQRIALIIAILLERPILLLDEISSALDAKCRQDVMSYLMQSDKTVLMVTHDAVLEGMCDRVVRLDRLRKEVV